MAVYDLSTFRSDVTVTATRDGREPVDLSRAWTSLAWSSNAVGGFGSCTLTLPGLYKKTRLNYLDKITVRYGALVLFEGRVEDLGIDMSGGEISTQAQAFGFARLLDDYSVRRIWSKRDLEWQDLNGYPAYAPTVGRFDSTDPTKAGFRLTGMSVASITVGTGRFLSWLSPVGTTVTLLYYDVAKVGTHAAGTTFYLAWDGGGGGSITGVSFSGVTVPASTRIDVGVISAAGSVIPDPTDIADFYNIRFVGTSILEDAPGGYYGGTILRDLIALVPDLQQGLIEDGSDFTIQALERAVRDTARSVVNEVAGYYTREWGVWENGRFDWKTPNLDEPQWLIDLAQLSDMNIRGTTDAEENVSYVLYTDAASGRDAEASSASTDDRNPYVKTGRARDGLTRPGFPMTANTAAALAAQVNRTAGAWPPVTGTVSLPLVAQITHATGPPRPAFLIRGGDNIRIVGLPKSDYLRPGRDGETLFHVSSVDVDVPSGRVRLTLEGQTRASDQLIARLAAVTRTLTS